MGWCWLAMCKHLNNWASWISGSSLGGLNSTCILWEATTWWLHRNWIFHPTVVNQTSSCSISEKKTKLQVLCPKNAVVWLWAYGSLLSKSMVAVSVRTFFFWTDVSTGLCLGVPFRNSPVTQTGIWCCSWPCNAAPTGQPQGPKQIEQTTSSGLFRQK